MRDSDICEVNNSLLGIRLTKYRLSFIKVYIVDI